MTDFLLLAAGGGEISQIVGLLAIMLGALVVVSLALVRLRQSVLVGYFLCGVMIANTGVLEWFGGPEMAEGMENLGQLGVVLLMFTLGVEFSLGELRHLRKAAFLGGGLQVGLTWAIGCGVGMAAGLETVPAVILGVALALSSTAVSMKSFQDLGESSGPAGRTALAIALFQDLLVVLFMLLLPALLLAGEQTEVAATVAMTVVKAILFLAVGWVLQRYVIPRTLLAVSRTRSRELFTIMVFALCAGVAWLAHVMGLNLALGAFVAGLVVSESMYSHRVLADVLPFKDLFLTLFFVFVGLGVDLAVVIEYWPLVLGGTAALILVKAGVLGLTCRILGLAPRSAASTIAALCSTGEFSLVLMAQAHDLVAWNESFFQVFVISTALSMALVPAMMRVGPEIERWLEERGWIPKVAPPPTDMSVRDKIRGLKDHAIVCGYGPVGQRLHRWLTHTGIETLVIEMNADTVRRLWQGGTCVLFADASHVETWELSRVAHSRFVAFTFPDSRVAFQATRIIRELCPVATILARTRYASDVRRLEHAGVDVVVLDEAESAMAMEKAAEAAFGRRGELNRGGEEVVEGA